MNSAVPRFTVHTTTSAMPAAAARVIDASVIATGGAVRPSERRRALRINSSAANPASATTSTIQLNAGLMLALTIL